jgi:enoyl-CoA hydratase/carnithine racemase
MSDRVVQKPLEGTPGVVHVELARPDKINALDAPMFDAIAEAGDRLAAEKALRCVVLSGQGRGFSAGLDFGSFMAMAGAGNVVERFFESHPDSPANRAQQVAHCWRSLEVPVIAAVHGACFGGGLQIALGADLRIVAPDAKLSVMEIKWGLIPDMTGSQTLRDLVRLDVAKELTFTGRVISGTEAVALGLATRVAETPLEAAFALARDIAARSPHAIRAAKKLLDQTRRLDLEEGLALEAQLQRELLGSPNQLEAVMANLEKRPPRFSDP